MTAPVEAAVAASGDAPVARRWSTGRITRVCATVLSLVLLGILAEHLRRVGLGSHGVRNQAWWAPILSICTMTLLSWTFLPAEIIAVEQGAAYGLIAGSAANLTAWLLSSSLQYAMSYFALGPGSASGGSASTAMAAFRKKLPSWTQRWNFNSPLALFLLHQVPYGSKGLSILAPRIGMSWSRRMRLAAVGLAPYAILCAAIGRYGIGH